MREQIEAAAAESQGIKNNAPQRQRRQWSQATKRQLVEQWQQSGKTRTQFCREHEICYTLFLGWIRDAAVGRGGFIEVNMRDSGKTSPRTPCDPVEIVSPNGWRIRLPREVDLSQPAPILNLVARC